MKKRLTAEDAKGAEVHRGTRKMKTTREILSASSAYSPVKRF
jgi:hypothetical protein